MQNRINLLNPSSSANRGTVSEGPGKQLATICLVAVLLTVAAYFVILGLEWNVRNRTAAVDKDIASLLAVEKQLLAKEALASEKKQVTAGIEKLKLGKPKLSAYLDELNKIIPVNLTLTNLDIKYEPLELTVRGVTYSPLYVAQFASNMQGSRYFKDCIITSTDKRLNDSLFDYVITITPDKKGGTNQ